MSEKIPVLCGNKMIFLDKPTPSKARKKFKDAIEEGRSKEVVKYTFVAAWTGFHCQATLHDVELGELQLEESYRDDEYASEPDLWATICEDYYPAMSMAGGCESPSIRSDWCEGGFGWSKEWARQMIDEENPPMLKFENIWDNENKIFWITANITPIFGYAQY